MVRGRRWCHPERWFGPEGGDGREGYRARERRCGPGGRHAGLLVVLAGLPTLAALPAFAGYPAPPPAPVAASAPAPDAPGPGARAPELAAEPSKPTAQPSKMTEQSPSPPVIVTAPIDSKVWEEAAPKFVESHSAPVFITEHLARWHAAICPLTRGLSPAMNDFVSARVREVAEGAGISVADPKNCKPNVEVIFTRLPQKLLDNVADGQDVLLGFHWVNQTSKVATMTRPIQSWYVTATLDPLGVEYIDRQEEFLVAGVPATPIPIGTRLSVAAETRIVHTLVVIDSNKVEGHTIGPVSDYIAMLTLAQPGSLDACSELPSILDLFSGGCPPERRTEALSDVDRAYLKALYVTNTKLGLTFQRGHIALHMKQYLGVH